MSDAFARNNNPAYFRFIELAKDSMAEAVFPLDRRAAKCCVQTVLRMMREEYVIAEQEGRGEERIRLLLNMNTRERRARKRHDEGTDIHGL